MDKGKKYILCILIFSFIVQSAIILRTPDIWWDEGTYIGMAKFLFSGGMSGFMEFYRPIILPIIIGVGWKIGLNPITFGKIFSMICGLMTIYMTYFIAKKVHNQNVGIIAALVISTTYYFLFFSTKILTGIPSLLLILLAINELANNDLREKNVARAGVLVALAFLMRYTAIMIIPAILLGILINSKKVKETTLSSVIAKNSVFSSPEKDSKYEYAISNIKVFFATFCATLAPYFIGAYLVYNDPLYSISRAISGIQSAEGYFTATAMDLAAQIFQQNPLLVFSLVGICYYMKKADANKIIILAALAMAVFMIANTPVKVLRYTIIALPFLSITAAFGIYAILKKLQIRKIKIPINVLTIIAAVIVLGAVLVYPKMPIANPSMEEIESIYNYPASNSIDGTIITSDPMISAYIDNRIVVLGWPNYTKANYEDNKRDSALIFVKVCDLRCPIDDSGCEMFREEFVHQIKEENRMIREELIDNCSHILLESGFYEKS